MGKLFHEKNFENLQIVNFESIVAEIIDISEDYTADLYSNQKYLLDMHRAVSLGLCKSMLASRGVQSSLKFYSNKSITT